MSRQPSKLIWEKVSKAETCSSEVTGYFFKSEKPGDKAIMCRRGQASVRVFRTIFGLSRSQRSDSAAF
ncbi:hypothetical protein JOB18_018571 [Solea senegalensis]|uniref:Uncharacterized protein n=1 Tax=Solea senegalensis TaxID=28829 RepID=A0AAV6RT93_SOLSE|nr:hypothetical protein JOB18_018571 [Solea senegalensis]